MGVRQDIATALSAVDGVTGYPIRPSGAKVGDAWLRWLSDEHEPEAPGVFVTTWQILVLVPQDEAKQEEWIATRRWPLHDAVRPYAFVTTMEPGQSSDGQPAMLINCKE